jgi:hypothetical protein
MSDIIIVNDILTGCMGERVFWDYMLEGIPNIHGVDTRSLSCPRHELEWRANQFINENFSEDAIIIQNATFLGKINHRHTIALLQDNLRGMNRYDQQQENVLKTSQIVVCNSVETAKSYPEYGQNIIPIGIDTVLFNKVADYKSKYDIPDTKVGIFVGAFNSVKGWDEIKNIIDNHPEIFFILVTKENETYQTGNSKSFSRVSQEVLVELLNCSDFFILGSSVETQCLAALEAGFCNLPIVMKETGIFMDFDSSVRNKLGHFGDLEHGIYSLDNNIYTPRETLMKLDFSIESMINKWKKLTKG